MRVILNNKEKVCGWQGLGGEARRKRDRAPAATRPPGRMSEDIARRMACDPQRESGNTVR